jgi:hypothetical protein
MAALSVASALAKKVPFISPVASLLLQALTMRSVSVGLTLQRPLSRCYVIVTRSKAVQGRVGCSHDQSRASRRRGGQRRNALPEI